MKRKPQPKVEQVIAPEILEGAKRSIATERATDRTPERLKAPAKCIVCSSEAAVAGTAGSDEQLCWICRRLKISAWRDVEAQIPVQD